MNDLKISLRLLDSSIANLIKEESDTNYSLYYDAYCKVAKLKIKNVEGFLYIDNELHWLYESVCIENYK